MKTKQYIVIGSVIVLVGILLSLDIKGLVKPEEGETTDTQASASEPATSVTLESVSNVAKQSISANLAADISKVETDLKEASEDETLKYQQELVQKWDDVNQPAAAAFYYEAIAAKNQQYLSWLKAGDKFTEGYQNFVDSSAVQGLTQKAIHAYQKALELNSESLEAKTGLGIAYVTGTSNPMQGIQLLLDVVKKDPRNYGANMNLGLFSMKSGQFEKAVNRFKTVIEVKPNAEAYFYLATSYENMGMKSEAVSAYEKSKTLAADPGLTAFVDRKIKELNN